MAFKINHLHLKTPDPRKTADWYVNYVGAKVVNERQTPSGRTTFRLNLHGVELNVTEFLEEGGFTEKLYRTRSQMRKTRN